MFEHLPHQCYSLPKLTAPLAVSSNASSGAGKRKCEDDPDSFHHVPSTGFNSLMVSKEQTFLQANNYQSEDEGQECKKIKTDHNMQSSMTPEYSTTTTTPNLDMQNFSSPFPSICKHTNNEWFYSFNMMNCVRVFESYLDDSRDINNIKMSTQDYYSFCNAHSFGLSSGLLRLFKDLGFNSFFDYRYFIFVFLFNFQSKLTISRSEWVFGMFNLQCDSVEKLKNKIDEVTQESYSWNPEQMKNFFAVTFKVLRESEKSRSIDVHVASYALLVLMNGRSPFTETFSAFLVSEENPIRSINLDQWKIFVDFSANIAANLSNYDPNDAWPSLYDMYCCSLCGYRY